MSGPWWGIPAGIRELQRQSLTLHKAAFDSALAILTLHFDSQETLFFRILDQMPWIPENARRGLERWATTTRGWREDFRAVVYRTFELAQECLDRSDPSHSLIGPGPGTGEGLDPAASGHGTNVPER
jgi:hypothetical protein